MTISYTNFGQNYSTVYNCCEEEKTSTAQCDSFHDSTKKGTATATLLCHFQKWHGNCRTIRTIAAAIDKMLL